MNNDLNCLRDPITNQLVEINNRYIITKNGVRYPIVNNIPRFVSEDNYSADFGLQWKKFRKTQLDSFTDLSITETRLNRCLKGELDKVKGKLVLEIGSGAGRFTEILLKKGAIVHSLDYSNAVEANAENNGAYSNLTLVQGDIRNIPFQKYNYDYVICLGVLQHTPDPEMSIKLLWEMVKPRGIMAIDHYIWKWRIILPPPIGEALKVYRFINLRLPKKLRYKFVKKLVDFWFPIHWFFRNSILIQRILRRISPVLFYYPRLKLRDREMYYEWALLDTHDGTTDVYKHRRTKEQIEDALNKIGASNISVSEDGNGIEAYCKKE